MKKIDKDNSVPAYQQIADQIKEQIQSSEIKIGSHVGTEASLAREYSVSRMTARAALKLLEDERIVVSNGSKGRSVSRVPDPSSEKSALMENGGPVIGIYPFRAMQYDDPYYGQLMDGITNGALANNVTLKFLQRRSGSVKAFMDSLWEKNIKGIIGMIPAFFDEEEKKELARNGIPIVFLNHKADEPNVDYIATDNIKGGMFLMDCLFHMGHRRIACVGLEPKSCQFAAERFDAYKMAHEKYKVAFTPDSTLFYSPEREGWEAEFDRRMRGLVSVARPTALFATGGQTLPPIFDSLRGMGLSVPSDLSVVCFDETPTSPGAPKVTCVRQQAEKMGAAAIDILLKRLEDGKRAAFKVVMAPEFVPGDSCGFQGPPSMGTEDFIKEG